MSRNNQERKAGVLYLVLLLVMLGGLAIAATSDGDIPQIIVGIAVIVLGLISISVAYHLTSRSHK